MPDFSWGAIAAAITAFLAGGGGKWILDFLKERYSSDLAKSQANATIRLGESEQAFKIYKEVMSGLQADIKKLNDDMHKMEEQHISCREENAKLKGEIQTLKARIEYLEEKIKIQHPDIGPNPIVPKV